MSQTKLFFKLFIWVIGTTYGGSVSGQQDPYFEYTPATQSIYRHIIDLKLDLAAAKLESRAHNNTEANNLAYHHIASYMDFFRVFISEEQQDFEAFIQNKNHRITALERLPDRNPYKSYAIAELKLQSALIRAKFDEVFGASREVYSAYKLLKKNAEKHPDFIYNNKSLSVIHTLVETVTLPGILKKLLKIQGSLELGLQEIESILHHSHRDPNFIFQEEVDAIYLYILLFQAGEKETALAYLESSRLDPSSSLLSVFMVSKLYQRAHQNDKALGILAARPRGTEYSTFPFLDYLEGLSHMRKGDWQRGIEKLDDFINVFEGRHYLKEAYQKKAWCKLMQGDVPAYLHQISEVEKKGNKVVDADKQAMNEASKGRVPDEILLKARIWYDGGYYTRALTLLTRNAHKFAYDDRQIEFNYRMGRITQALKNYTEAIRYFRAAKIGGESRYEGCNSALQIGLIYEEQKEYVMSKKYFEECLEMDPDNYKNSMHQKAKSGLQRIRTHIK